MNRREFLAIAASSLPAAKIARAANLPAADVTLRIGEITADLEDMAIPLKRWLTTTRYRGRCFVCLKARK
jgi:hypothetical protein